MLPGAGFWREEEKGVAAARGRNGEGLGFGAAEGVLVEVGSRWRGDVAAPEPRELTCSLVALTVRGRSTGQGLAGPCCAAGCSRGSRRLGRPVWLAWLPPARFLSTPKILKRFELFDLKTFI